MTNNKQKLTLTDEGFLRLLLERGMVALEYNHPAMLEDPEMRDDPRWIKKRAELIEETIKEGLKQYDKRP